MTNKSAAIFNAATENLLYGDANRIRQIALNLLTNTVKYTKVGGVEFTVDSQTVSVDTINLTFNVTYRPTPRFWSSTIMK